VTALDGRTSAEILDPRRRTMAMAVIMVATIMVVLDTTIVNVALPQIGEALDAGSGVEWVVSAYLLAVAVALPVTGWVANRFGPTRVFMWSLGLFVGASLMCALSPTLPFLIGARVLQGIGGGALMPVAMTIVMRMYPKERHGRALAAWGISSMAAPAIGPTLGGWLVTTVDWHWLFLINVPIGVVALLAGYRFLPVVPRSAVGPFDLIGFLAGSIGLAAFVFGLSEANRWGWSSPATVVCIGGGALLLAVMVVHELHTPTPMLEMRMFGNRTFTLAFLISALVISAQYARLVFLPLFLEGEAGYSAFEIGLMFAPAGVTTAIAMHFGGVLSDRVGPKAPIVAGTAIGAFAVFCVAAFGLSQPLWVLAALLGVQGLGMGLHIPPATVMAMNTLPEELLSQGSAMRALASQIAGALSVAGLGTLLAIALPADATAAEARSAYDLVFYVSFAGMLVAVALAVALKPQPIVHDPERDELEARERTAFALLE
jgi:EmrB/QacA subfamily drug resistance transporter